MKPLILTAMTVIGLFGIIGTIEYSHAQTPLTITAKNIPSQSDKAIEIRSTAPTNTWINIEGNNIHNAFPPTIGSVYGKLDSLLQSNSIFENAPINSRGCLMNLQSVKIILTRTSEYNIQNLAVPDNIIPIGINNIHAIGFDFRPDNQTAPCTPDLEAQTDGTNPLLMRDGKELRWIINGKHDKKPYYFSPRDNIIQAQPIPICTRDNFNTTTQTLKGTLQMCYGTNANDMIIITKRLMGFYGTADTVNTPTKTVDFSPSPATILSDNNNNICGA